MKPNPSRSWSSRWIAFALLPLFSPQEGAPSPEIEALVSRISAAYADCRDMEIPFRQTKHVSILKDSLHSSGVALWRPNRLLFRTLEPSFSEVLITDREILIWIPESKQIEKYDRSQFKLMEAVDLGVGQDVRKMVSSYEIRQEPSPSGADTLRLHLTPIDKQILKYVREMTMEVRAKDALIRSMEYTDASSDRTRTEFDLDQRKINQGLTDDQIRLSAPADTRIVEPLRPGK